MSDDPALTAALLQISGHAERLAAIERAEAEHRKAVSASLADVHVKVAALRGTLAGQGKVLVTLDGLAERVDELAGQVAGLLPPEEQEERGYRPQPSARWWDMTGDDRQTAVDRIAEWVRTIYRPHFGHLAARLGECWESHDLCLVQLDWVSELHRFLWHPGKRTAGLLTAQAEFGTRIVPAVAEQLRTETSTCRHGRTPAANGSSWRGAR